MPDLRRHRPFRALVLGGVVAAGLLTGCGQDDAGGGAGEDTAPDPAARSTPSNTPSSTPSSTPSGAPADPDAPACGEVWVTGETIPRGYAGCNDGEVFLEPDVMGCSSGQRFITFEDRWYGVLGGTVREGESPLAQDREYRSSVASCRA